MATGQFACNLNSIQETEAGECVKFEANLSYRVHLGQPKLCSETLSQRNKKYKEERITPGHWDVGTSLSTLANRLRPELGCSHSPHAGSGVEHLPLDAWVSRPSPQTSLTT